MSAIKQVDTNSSGRAAGAGNCDQRRVPVTRWVDEPVDLVAIYDDLPQVCYLDRQPAPVIQDYCQTLSPSQLRGNHHVLKPGQKPALVMLPSGPGRDALCEDIAFVVELFANLTGCPQVGVRLSHLDQAMCPRFHIDHIAIRMTCTYTGPGTEWIDRDIRHRGGPLEIDPSREQVHCAEPGALVFLKGGQWVGNRGRGAVHRSPDVPAHHGHRVLLTVDAIWSSQV